MFDNILGHTALIDQLSHGVRSATLPATLLFAGPSYGGKLTTALELARSLSCEEDAAWSCRCRHCAQQRALLHPETLLIGNRSFLPEVYLARAALLRNAQPATLFLFIRSVRKLIRRFDPVLWDGEEQRVAKTTDLLDGAEEELRGLDQDAVKSDDLSERSARIVSFVEQALQRAPADLSPIAVVRNMAFWARVAPAGKAKVAVIDGADSLNDAARNAILKILEEPPPSVHFVLIAERGQAVIDTIRSRARSFSFTQRDRETEQAVITRIFRDPHVDSPSLRDYVLSNGGEGPGGQGPNGAADGDGAYTSASASSSIVDLARDTADTLVAKPGWERRQRLQEVARRAEAALGRKGYRAFFEELLEFSAEMVGAGDIESVQRRKLLGDLVAEATHRADVLHMTLLNVLEDLLYKLEHNAEVH